MAEKASVIYILAGAAIAAVLLKKTETGQKVIDMTTGTTRGIRNNNPGNIEFNSANVWKGQTGDDGRFSTFDSMANGVRALTILLINYYTIYGAVTVRTIINRYAPGHENPTDNYVLFVANALQVHPDEMINLDEHILGLVDAIIRFENGKSINGRDLVAGFKAGMMAKGLNTQLAGYALKMEIMTA